MNMQMLHYQLYNWYQQEHRILPWRDTSNAYHIWLSEIILQQTRVSQGMDYYLRFVEHYPTVEDLAQAPESAVLRDWQGLGYYSRARHLHEAAKMIVANGWSPFPRRYEDIRQLPGVGDYTAGAISSFAYNAPYPAMDGNVYRVLSRLMDDDTVFDTNAGKRHFHTLILSIMDSNNPRLFNSAIMEFGALYCTPSLRDSEGKSICEECPLATFCQAYHHGTAHLLPLRKPKAAIRDRYLTYSLYINEQRGQLYTLIHQRQEKDIWQHLYEFPMKEADHILEPQIPADGRLVDHVDYTHLLSHQRLHARFYLIEVNQLPDTEGTQIIECNQLDDFAFSRLTLRAIEHWKL